MEPKKRVILVAAIAVVMVLGVVSSFGLPLFTRTPSISLPALRDTEGEGAQGATMPGQNSDFTWVMITTETVQNVIATLHRADRYYREISVKRYWGDGDSNYAETPVLVWADGGCVKTATMLPDGNLQNTITIQGVKYTWYGNDRTYHKQDTNEIGNGLPARIPDLAQSAPTYETVLLLSPDAITAAGYETKLGQSCIYVEARTDLDGVNLLERYWISVDSGLLIASESESMEDGLLTYQMTEVKISDLESNMTSFVLPDGMVLHVVVRAQAEE